jgi:4-amino-4-deoxy-L-arabinose transferase-like glycosyltransferase
MEEPLNQETKFVFTDIDVPSLFGLYENARRYARTHAAELACAGLLLIMSLQMYGIVTHKSITIDEIVMIPAAYYHLATGDFQFVNEHPPLSKIFAAVPLLFVQPNETLPGEVKGPPTTSPYKWEFEERFWGQNRSLFHSISFWARVPMIFLTIILGVLIFSFARQLFGDVAAVFAVALFSLEPTMIAHGRVVQTDVPAALGYLLLFMMIYRYIRRPNYRSAALLGSAAAVAALAKYSMIIAAPILALVFFTMLLFGPRLQVSRQVIAGHALIASLMIIVVINAAYFFQHRSLTGVEYGWMYEAFPSRTQFVIGLSRVLSYILPADFIFGILFQISHNRLGHSAGFLGMYRQTGWWYYYPVAFTLKTTLPFLLLSLAALGSGIYKLIATRDVRYFVLLGGFSIYTVFVLFAKIDIGVRYFLPAYTFLFILGGALLAELLKARRVRAVVIAIVVALCSWIVIEAIRAHPNQMSYMNQLASGHPHWWYLSDSNVEWGDDARPLAEYLRARGETAVRGAFLSGFLTLHHYGVDYVDILGPESIEIPHTKYIAIGASFLNGSTVPFWQKKDGTMSTEAERVNRFDAYRRRIPEAVIGNSIYLFREE